MNILLFGITRDIIGKSRLYIPAEVNLNTVLDLKDWLSKQYPAIQALSSLAVAVDNEYADNEHAIHAGQEIALIPPVSGG